jgi:hypothetical protein
VHKLREPRAILAITCALSPANANAHTYIHVISYFYVKQLSETHLGLLLGLSLGALILSLSRARSLPAAARRTDAAGLAAKKRNNNACMHVSAAPLLNYERTLDFLKIPGSLCERFTVISPADEMMDIKLYFTLYVACVLFSAHSHREHVCFLVLKAAINKNQSRTKHTSNR